MCAWSKDGDLFSMIVFMYRYSHVWHGHSPSHAWQKKMCGFFFFSFHQFLVVEPPVSGRQTNPFRYFRTPHKHTKWISYMVAKWPICLILAVLTRSFAFAYKWLLFKYNGIQMGYLCILSAGYWTKNGCCIFFNHDIICLTR